MIIALTVWRASSKKKKKKKQNHAILRVFLPHVVAPQGVDFVEYQGGVVLGDAVVLEWAVRAAVRERE